MFRDSDTLPPMLQTTSRSLSAAPMASDEEQPEQSSRNAHREPHPRLPLLSGPQHHEAAKKQRSERPAHEDWPWASCEPVCCGDGLPQHANEHQDPYASKGFAQSLTYDSRAAVRSNDRADFICRDVPATGDVIDAHNDRSQPDEENAEI